MINTFILIVSLLIFLMISFLLIRSWILKQKDFGKPSVHILIFICAKIFVLTGLVFLLFRGIGWSHGKIFYVNTLIEFISIGLLISGIVIIIITAIQLNKALIFGLSDDRDLKLQTRGIFKFSRHPFYMGFILILFSSCILYPHILNLISFTGASIIHHFIMISEENHLCSIYGDEYLDYKKRVNRYITF